MEINMSKERALELLNTLVEWTICGENYKESVKKLLFAGFTLEELPEFGFTDLEENKEAENELHPEKE